MSKPQRHYRKDRPASPAAIRFVKAVNYLFATYADLDVDEQFLVFQALLGGRPWTRKRYPLPLALVRRVS